MTFGKTSVGEAPQRLTDHRWEMTAGISVPYMNRAVGTSLDAFRDHFFSRVRLGAVLTGKPPSLTAPADRPFDPSQFAPVAEMIGADVSDPVSWPGSIFLTMDAFRRASQG